MTPDVEAERQSLRQRRTVLQREHDALLAAGERLAGEQNVDLIHAHAERLARHRVAVQAFHDALAIFHERVGPLDE
jgi:hypothetical protein